MRLPFDPAGAACLALPGGGSVHVPTYRVDLTEWSGTPLRDTYGGKTAIDVGGVPLFAELALLRLLEHAGWQGVWADTYRRRFLQAMPDLSPRSAPLPQDPQRVYNQVKAANGGRPRGCWDLLLWRGDLIAFVESKRRGKDAIKATQLAWLQAALSVGVEASAFAIVEWDVSGRP